MLIPPTVARKLYWKSQSLRGREDIQRRLSWLEQTQWLSPQELERIQLEKLQSIVKHAFDTVPYYRRLMDERGLRPAHFTSVRDLHKLPILTRSVLRAEQQGLLSSEADRGSLQQNFSSGSTGIRAAFHQDASFRLWMRAHQLRTYQWCADWKLGEPFVLLWGSEIYWSLKQFVDRLDNLLTNRREYNTFRLSPNLISQFLDQLQRFRPALISTYSNAMHLITLEATRKGLRIPGLRAIQGTSEPLPPAMRDRMTAVLGCEVFDKYGMRETNIVSHESPRHEQMCIQMENVVIEFLNDHDQPCGTGERGRLIVTTLNNYSMPLIRYETSDLAAPVVGYCSSGIGLQRMTSVAGRLQDLILTPKGDHIDSYFFSYLIMRFDEIHWFQVVQTDIDRLRIRLFAPTDLQRSTLDALSERIHHHTGFPFKIEFETLLEMPPSSTGKYRLCVSALTKSSDTAQGGDS